VPSLTDPIGLVSRMRRDLDRAALRTRHGLKHLAGLDRPPVGTTPKTLVWQRDKVHLYRYDSDERRLSPPILLVMSLVTKPYVFDLRPGNSFVEVLLGRGFDVYVLDWGVPDAVDSQNTFETYCDEYLPRASAAVLSSSGASDLSVYGYCLGAVLALMFVAGHPEIPVRSIATMAAPIDPRHMGSLCRLLRKGNIEPRVLLDETGNVPASVMLQGIRSFKTTGDLASFAGLLANLDSREYIAAHQALNGWATDHIPFPGACFEQMVEWFLRDDQLAQGRIELGGRAVDLRSIACPTVSIWGQADHLVPPASVAPLKAVLPDVDELVFPAGHVGLIVGGSAQRRTIPAIAGWLEQHAYPAA
jgi:polyhydroxyalkanoate synthase